MQDYEDFDLANELDELEKFLKVTPAISTAEITFDSKSQGGIQENGNTSSREVLLKRILLDCWFVYTYKHFLCYSSLSEKKIRSAKIEIAISHLFI